MLMERSAPTPHGKSNTVVTFGAPAQILSLLMEVIGMVKSMQRSFLLQFRNVSCDRGHFNDRPYQVLDFGDPRGMS